MKFLRVRDSIYPSYCVVQQLLKTTGQQEYLFLWKEKLQNSKLFTISLIFYSITFSNRSTTNQYDTPANSIVSDSFLVMSKFSLTAS